MKEKVTLNRKEQKQLLVMNVDMAELMIGQQIAESLGIAERYTRRILAKYRRSSFPHFS